MRVLITGAAGIIGTVLTKGLRDRYELHRRPARTACAVLFTPAVEGGLCGVIVDR